MQIALGQPFQLDQLGLPQGCAPLVLLWVTPGSFTMGAAPEDPEYTLEEAPAFRATLTAGFWLGRCPVTQAQWTALMGANPSHFPDPTGDRPAEQVCWHDALAFCNTLHQRFGERLPPGYGFSLPTEMQWEYACRAGCACPISHGDSEADLARAAWYGANSGGQTHPVGQREPNRWGFCDMHGNVNEWCYDAAEDYPPADPVDWVGARNPRLRSLRGGNYHMPWNDALACPSRACVEPELRRPWLGFRLAVRQVGLLQE